MIKIIKQGTIIKETRYALCSRCGCEFTYEKEDLISGGAITPTADGVKCPCCGEIIYLSDTCSNSSWGAFLDNG